MCIFCTLHTLANGFRVCVRVCVVFYIHQPKVFVPACVGGGSVWGVDVCVGVRV